MYYGDISTEQEFIQFINSASDVNILDDFKSSLIYAAAAKGFINAVILLCDKNANLNLKGGAYGQNTALNVACEKCHVEMVELLLNKGAKPIYGSEASPINSNGIIRLLEHNEDILVKLLLENNWAPNSCDLNDNTLIKTAIQKQKPEIFKLVIEKGARINKSVLDLILSVGNDQILESLLLYQYKSNAIDKDFWFKPQLKDFSKIATFLSSDDSKEKLELVNELLQSEKSPLFLEVVFSNSSNLLNLHEIILPLSIQAVKEDNHDIDLTGLADLSSPGEVML